MCLMGRRFDLREAASDFSVCVGDGSDGHLAKRLPIHNEIRNKSLSRATTFIKMSMILPSLYEMIVFLTNKPTNCAR
jgi:hypothetical protein